MLNYVCQFSKSGQFSTRFIFETKSVTPLFFFWYFLTQVTHHLTAINKIIDWNIFARKSSVRVEPKSIKLCCFLQIKLRYNRPDENICLKCQLPFIFRASNRHNRGFGFRFRTFLVFYDHFCQFFYSLICSFLNNSFVVAPSITFKQIKTDSPVQQVCSLPFTL